MTETTFAPTVLLYALRGLERRALLCQWLTQAGIRAKEVQPGQYQQPLGLLLALPGFEPLPGQYPGLPFGEEMLVMFGFRGSMLNDLLRFFRQTGLAPVELKAMATPTNIHWSSLQLYEALRAERAQLQTLAQKERGST